MTLEYYINTPYQLTKDNLFNLSFPYQLPILNADQYQSHVPNINENYLFNDNTTEAILLGLLFKKRVLLHGLHGSGKSSHIEQVAARLNWPVLRINFDGFLSRFELIGRDQIVIKDESQITEFKYGLLPWVITKPFILILDEYDAARPELLFVFQRLLENDGKLALFETNEVITPHPDFRIMATCNTIGNGDEHGIYNGTNILNQAQLDRWNIILQLDYLKSEQEIITAYKLYPQLTMQLTEQQLNSIILFIDLLRKSFYTKEITTFFSTRNMLNFMYNICLFNDIKKALTVSFINRLDSTEKYLIEELYQRCFD
ncbi:AAA family ATPase [Rickettsiales endosymbiont of Stachyamoeba lipophora]|uniref:AAA family ATPase n=1 Tax=Rickettsiales endosymbiont of Stachyamoeba lipophora TaxID=2486578 RepID=UPI000F64DCB0|nr:MoxR family ATPase [Rickettsiales endosymbiont of Stachyamoeba lipophora]AZL15441.1 AAA family ATPase [Rickettsiales endosymbiont of Stachyamoeba lipophora]